MAQLMYRPNGQDKSAVPPNMKSTKMIACVIVVSPASRAIERGSEGKQQSEDDQPEDEVKNGH
ncbi:hypothetical protein [Rhizobium sp. NFR07]|uniref:hypothetical protein n=1 Tax=Rhizobium sp. NFR07 TaxID=1566262 RepID=UPI0015A5319A|nr:hypothetical protein [Rhizobium sp. NFR07]